MDFLRILLSILIPPLGCLPESRYRLAFLAQYTVDALGLHSRSDTCHLHHLG